MARNLRFLLLAPLALAGVSLSACTTRTIDLPKVLQLTDVETGYFDAGIVDGKNKLVPAISIRLKNNDTEKVSSVQMIARFNRIGEAEEWGSAPYVRAIGPEGLAPGQTGDPIVMKCDRGYTGEQSRALMFTHSQFLDARVELFAKYAAQPWAKMGEYKLSRQLLTR